MDSPISSTLQLDRLVLSNEPLTPAQSQFVHAQIAMVNMSISRLDKEMQYFTQRLQSLRSRRGELAHTKEAYSNLLSPWRSLPTEILTEILRFTIVQRGGLPASAQLATLSQVCRRWSNVVQDTPGLWCELEVDERMKEADGSRLVSKLEKHYSRAGSMPWSISFSSDRLIQRNHSRLSIPPTPSPIVLFLKKSVRWKSIRFTHQHLDMLAPLFSLDPSRPQYSWPELEALHLKGWYYGPAKADPFLDPTRPLYMGSMPRLTALTLHTFDQEISNWVLPWHQLTYLHLATADSYRHYLNILKSCPNLEECIISIPPTIDSTAFAATQRQQAPTNPIVLPRLHSLEVAHASIAWPFFSAITLPALTSLSVSSPPPDGREIDRLLAGTLSDMISRSACTLHSLTLKNTPLKDGDYVNILRQTTDLRRLDIVDWHASPPFWLEYVNKGDMIPRLKEMSMQGYLEKDTLLREYLFQFLECRGAIGYDEEGPFYADEVHFSEHVFRWRGKSRIQ